jgi:hypothetical protein
MTGSRVSREISMERDQPRKSSDGFAAEMTIITAHCQREPSCIWELRGKHSSEAIISLPKWDSQKPRMIS